MKKKDIIKVLSRDGEIHFILRDRMLEEEPIDCVCLRDDAEIVTVLKREASKPLLLLRRE